MIQNLGFQIFCRKIKNKIRKTVGIPCFFLNKNLKNGNLIQIIYIYLKFGGFHGNTNNYTILIVKVM